MRPLEKEWRVIANDQQRYIFALEDHASVTHNECMVSKCLNKLHADVKVRD